MTPFNFFIFTSSRLDYVAPARPKDSSTVNYAYFKRDNRRNFESEIAIRPQKALPSGNEYSTIAPTSGLPPRPGRPHHYNKSAHQPPHSGYFPIINCE